jgi:hypothetical protein
MRELLFDTPYWLLGLLGVVGIALWVSGNGRQDKTLQRVGYALLAAGVALFLMSWFVDTDKETVAKRTRQIVTAVEKKDKETLAKLLHPDATLMGMTKKEIVEAAGKAVDRYHLKNVRTASVDATQPNRAEVIVDLSVTADVETMVYTGSVPTSWDLVWAKSGGEWLLRDIKSKKAPAGADIGNEIRGLK